MIDVLEAAPHEFALRPMTDGGIAAVNLQSARLAAWQRFRRMPLAPGLAERLVQLEQQAVQFLGDLGGLGRLDALVEQLEHDDADSAATALVHAQVDATAHRFADARQQLLRAAERGAPAEPLRRLSLSIDQACGSDLPHVLHERRKATLRVRRLEDLVPLGALLADLRDFDQADRIYQEALAVYDDVSPFAAAWVCFQLGLLWGEQASEPQTERAARWYRHAIELLPDYVKARVHLAEIELDEGRGDAARLLLQPALASGDPETNWRYAQVLQAAGLDDECEAQLHLARAGFDRLLEQHPLAFADHGAEFFADCGDDTGDDMRRALQLAQINVANRPTLQAFEQAHEIAIAAGDVAVADELLSRATQRWASTPGFVQSPLNLGDARLALLRASADSVKTSRGDET